MASWVATFGYVQEVSAPWNPCCWGAENGFYKTKVSMNKYTCRAVVLLHFSHWWRIWKLEEIITENLRKTTLLFWWWAPERDRNKNVNFSKLDWLKIGTLSKFILALFRDTFKITICFSYGKLSKLKWVLIRDAFKNKMSKEKRGDPQP